MTSSQRVSEEMPAPLPLGTLIGGRYELVDQIAGGGMGYVFKAVHIALNRPVALKVLRLGSFNEELVRRFHREAQALAKLNTPRVAQVTDFGMHDETGPFYVMELVEGETLGDRVARGPIAPDAVEKIAIGLLQAIGDVHAAGIVHRDLKPTNIGIPEHGPVVVKLLDFGLAAGIDDTFFTRITQSQQVLGSIPYIAPEQFQGVRPTPALDLWALGIIVFEMLVGKLPFVANSTAAMMHQILTSPVPSFPTDTPPKLKELVQGLLHKDPEKRLSVSDALLLLGTEPDVALPHDVSSITIQTQISAFPETPISSTRAVSGFAKTNEYVSTSDSQPKVTEVSQISAITTIAASSKIAWSFAALMVLTIAALLLFVFPRDSETPIEEVVTESTAAAALTVVEPAAAQPQPNAKLQPTTIETVAKGQTLIPPSEVKSAPLPEKIRPRRVRRTKTARKTVSSETPKQTKTAATPKNSDADLLPKNDLPKDEVPKDNTMMGTSRWGGDRPATW